MFFAILIFSLLFPSTLSQSELCRTSYGAREGDTCERIEAEFKKTHDQFIELNPSVNIDCSRLRTGGLYCVEPRQLQPDQSKIVPVRDEFERVTDEKTEEVIAPLGAPKRPSKTSKPGYQSKVESKSKSKENTKGRVHQEKPTQEWDQVPAEPQYWEPPSYPTFILPPSAQTQPVPSLVIVAPLGWLSSFVPEPTSIKIIPSEIPSSVPIQRKCGMPYVVQSGDTCWAIARKFGIILEDFFSLNPNVGSQCSALLPGDFVCVASFSEPPNGQPSGQLSGSTVQWSGSSITRPSSEPWPAGDQTHFQPGTTANCRRWHFVKEGESCWMIERKYGITPEQFRKWNPAVDYDCLTMPKDVFVCVQV